jgi:hypothetical protein
LHKHINTIVTWHGYVGRFLDEAHEVARTMDNAYELTINHSIEVSLSTTREIIIDVIFFVATHGYCASLP